MNPIDFRIKVKDHHIYVGQERKKFLFIPYWKTIYETSDKLKAMSTNTRILDNVGCNLISVSPEYNPELSLRCPIPYKELYGMTKDAMCFYWKF